jgi:type II secretory pathway predicted ATPase ExeA
MARHILRCLNLPTNVQTLPEALMTLQSCCQNDPKRLSRSLLLIDEAHNLAYGEGFYLAHYLCNLRIPEANGQAETPLFTLILAGTDNLRESLKTHESLRRRIQLDWQLTPLTAQADHRIYPSNHMRAVGGDIWSFSKGALDDILPLQRRAFREASTTTLRNRPDARVRRTNAERQ